MAGVYVHLNGKDLDKDILGLHGVQTKEHEKPFETTPLAPIECPRCKNTNSATATYCSVYGMVLDEKTALVLKENNRLEALEKEVKELREFIEEFFPITFDENKIGKQVNRDHHFEIPYKEEGAS